MLRFSASMQTVSRGASPLHHTRFKAMIRGGREGSIQRSERRSLGKKFRLSILGGRSAALENLVNSDDKGDAMEKILRFGLL